MAMTDNALRALFSDLQSISRVTHEKPDPHQNLTDILEILAVGAELRPAHLQGQGFRDETRSVEVEKIAVKHGLRTIRTKEMLPFRERASRCDPEINDAFHAKAVENQRAAPEVTWVYAEHGLPQAIASSVAGTASVTPVLGYPPCCVSEDAEHKVLMQEAYVDGLMRASLLKTNADVLRLWNEDVKVEVTVPEDVAEGAVEPTLRRFPYIQFGACRSCRNAADSPAALINRRLRNLAFEMSGAFGCSIWESRDLIVERGKRVEVGRNDPCPCGSELKFKRCCLPLAGKWRP